MADLAGITAVRPTSNTVYRRESYGATIAAGNSLYVDSADNEYKLADADASEAAAAAKGIAITPGIDGGQGLIATGGSVILVGTTMTVGETYVVSATPGAIAPIGDLTTGDYVTILGVAATANQLDLFIKPSGTQKP